MNTYAKPLNSHDIARHAGVSQTTVSRVLSGNSKVKPATRDRVLEVIRELNFQPNAFAQAMKTKLSSTIGVVVSRITNPIVPEILLQVGNQLTANGRRMAVWNTDTEGEEGVVNAIRQHVVDGLIFTAAGHPSVAMDTAIESGLPVAFINRHVEGAACDQFIGTDYDGARTLTDYLLRSGRQKIAMINGPLDRSTLADREKGVRDHLADAGMTLADSYYARSDFAHEAFRALAIEMMSQQRTPDAIFCGNDVIAFAVLCGLRAAGCSVPKDVWVTGFDGIEMSGWDVFDMTTMQQPLAEMATAAVEAIIGHIEGNRTEKRMIRFGTKLIIRGSTANQPYHPNS